jgi:hypothetical protein
MVGKKYIIKNICQNIIFFNYRTLSNSMEETQVPLLPGQTKHVWCYNNTLIFLNNQGTSSCVDIIEVSDFPPIHSPKLPIPTPTPTQTPTQTETPTNTPTPTETPTNTPTQTPTNTETPTQTQTPTRSYYVYSLGFGANEIDACNDYISSPSTIYGTVSGGIGPNIGEYLYSNSGLTIPTVNGYYSNGTAIYVVTGGLGQITSSDPSGC